MELKSYQQTVIDDLNKFLGHLQTSDDVRLAFNSYWEEKLGTAYNPLTGKGMRPYQSHPLLTDAPQVCIKVPTAGGKTFIACNAIQPIFNHYKNPFGQMVIWLVPSRTILDQTITALTDPAHAYRQKINQHFGSRVNVLTNDDALQGKGFNPTALKEQLTILVLSFDSLRSKDKDNRKLHEPNGRLLSFAEGKEVPSVVNIIQRYRPLVIIDESHNAKTELSVDMLCDLHPSFIFELTATPRQSSNIISFVDALQLKKNNMVKLPVIVTNRRTPEEVVDKALKLRRALEAEAKKEEQQTGKYIRPIILFQAQPRKGEEQTTFQEIKKMLLACKVPEEQIKIKTADINEIKGIDLNSPKCKVRYIITVNALKEGWDCPFAYILATVADKSSAVDVEQILGRVLRQPHVVKHNSHLLNSSYVITSSRRFEETLDSIIKGLKQSGYSEKDHRVAENEIPETEAIPREEPKAKQPEMFRFDGNVITPNANLALEGDNAPPITSEEIIEQDSAVKAIVEQAARAEVEMQAQIQLAENNPVSQSTEITAMALFIEMLDEHKKRATEIRLPQFFIKNPFDASQTHQLDRENLCAGIKLANKDSDIDFGASAEDIRKVDIVKTVGDDYTPVMQKMSGAQVEALRQYISDLPTAGQIKKLTELIVKQLDRFDYIAQADLKKYIGSIVETFTDSQREQFLDNQNTYISKIKNKIVSLCNEHAEKSFFKGLSDESIILQPNYLFPTTITAGTDSTSSLSKSLYQSEGKMNTYERKVITELTALDNVVFWHRIIDRQGFGLNGFINHYPDFVVLLKSGKVILIESKAEFLDGSDSQNKINLGEAWESAAGKNNFRYFMVFEKKEMDGAILLQDLITTLSKL